MSARLDNRLSLNCEQALHSQCDGIYLIGTCPVPCHCRCHLHEQSAAPLSSLSAPPDQASAAITASDPAAADGDSRAECDRPDQVSTPPVQVESLHALRCSSCFRSFYRGQRFRVLKEPARTGVLQTLTFTPEKELITLLFDDPAIAPRIATFLMNEVEEVLGVC